MQLIDGDRKDHIQIKKKRKRRDMPSCDKAEASGQKGMLTPPRHLIRSCYSALNKMVDSLIVIVIFFFIYATRRLDIVQN